MSFNYQIVDSPVGRLYVVEEGQRLSGIIFEQNWFKYTKHFSVVQQVETSILKKARTQLDEYFNGQRKSFELPYVLYGTEFQNRVWKALESVPFGKTRTYKEQAALVGSPKAVRAVGRTNGLNFLNIILPCHRIIGSDGSLTGYGGGIHIKKYLLGMEGAFD